MSSRRKPERYLVLNAHMFGTPAAPGEHVNWSKPDAFTDREFDAMFEQTPAEYAADNPHMIVMEVT